MRRLSYQTPFSLRARQKVVDLRGNHQQARYRPPEEDRTFSLACAWLRSEHSAILGLDHRLQLLVLAVKELTATDIVSPHYLVRTLQDEVKRGVLRVERETKTLSRAFGG